MKKTLTLFCFLALMECACTKSLLDDSPKLSTQNVSSNATTAQPCPDTALLSGKTFSQKLDSAGKWHNDYQVSLLSQMISAKLNFVDTTKIHPFEVPRTSNFFFQEV